MTKHEILDKVSMATCDHTDFDGIYKAMDEYAKQQAIAFDVWKRENCITYDYENNAYSKLIFLDVDHTKVRTEQLSIDDTYNQFAELQSKEQ